MIRRRRTAEAGRCMPARASMQHQKFGNVGLHRDGAPDQNVPESQSRPAMGSTDSHATGASRPLSSSTRRSISLSSTSRFFERKRPYVAPQVENRRPDASSRTSEFTAA